MRRTMSEKRTAYHEAGHAVMSFELKLAIKKVSIIPDGKIYGYVKGGKSPDDIDYVYKAKTERWIEKQIMSLYSGYITEKMYYKRGSRIGSISDNSVAIDFANEVCGSEEEVSAYLKWLYIRAKNILNMDYNKHTIERLASLLLEKKEISGREARDFISQSILD